jgi:ADP-ribosyl-[dinitrogen reductase] hydrolase
MVQRTQPPVVCVVGVVPEESEPQMHTSQDPTTTHVRRIELPSGRVALTDVELQRVIGAVLGAAVGDALGAPFEFGPSGAYSERFPVPVLGGIGELTGGGAFGWAPGEFTDDTQMAVALAESLIANHGFEPTDVWERFVAWHSGARDCGVLTGAALRHDTHEGAALAAHRSIGRSAANGALMRVVGLACAFTPADESTLVAAARAQAALTHHDPAAGWGAAIAAAMIRRAILGKDPIDAIPQVLALVAYDAPEQHAVFAQLLHADWRPGQPDETSNGTVWTCLAQAIWAVRTTSDFAGALRAAIDLGGDTDTVATVTGAIAGARDSVQAIPSRWLSYVHGTVHTPTGPRSYDNAALQDLARRLIGRAPVSPTTTEVAAGPVEIAPGLHAADLLGAATVPESWAVVSMCRTGGRFSSHPVRREVFMIDQQGAANADLHRALVDAVDTIDALLAEGRQVVVHCHGGRSRTGLVLKAWAMRSQGLDERRAHGWLAEQWARYEDYQTSFLEELHMHWESSAEDPCVRS